MTHVSIPDKAIERYRKAVTDLLFTADGEPRPGYDHIIPPDMQAEWGLKHTNTMGRRDPNVVVDAIVQLSKNDMAMFAHFAEHMGSTTLQTFQNDFLSHLAAIPAEGENRFFPPRLEMHQGGRS